MRNKLAYLVSQLTYVNDYRIWALGAREYQTARLPRF